MRDTHDATAHVVPAPASGAAVMAAPPVAQYGCSMATHAAHTADRRLARTLGWLGVGTGVGALAAPRALATLVGAPDRRPLVRALGARELASGLGILAQRRPKSGWLWARVAGDAMDLALLGTALRVADGERRSRLVAT